MPDPNKILVAIIMGSKSDWPTMELAAKTLGDLGIAHDVRVVSAHRTPDALFAYVKQAEADGVEVIILRTTDAIASYDATVPVATQIASGAPLDYGKFLSWRGMVAVEPPNRPAPNRTSASAACQSLLSGAKVTKVASTEREISSCWTCA